MTYRLLNPDDIIREGDESFSVCEGWCREKDRIGRLVSAFFYRRPIRPVDDLTDEEWSIAIDAYHKTMCTAFQDWKAFIRKIDDLRSKPRETKTKARSCPICGALEVDYNGPRTKYACGTTTYDDRPKTFDISDECRKPKPREGAKEKWIRERLEECGKMNVTWSFEDELNQTWDIAYEAGKREGK